MNHRQVHALDVLLDDHFALWDLADSLPEFRPTSEPSFVDDLVELVREGLIAVEFGGWFDNDTEPVPLTEAEQALRDPANWQPTGRHPGYVVALAPAGEERLRLLGIGSS